mmetsp:Transcript_72546/g.212816  ORF Transcript_72546/g.212816 Transcript_72546/m.212816 type:complete len:354 (-) Transcript_72546:9-1070(-)
MPYGCWKISDGLFLGNQECAADLDFMEENKVTRVINCSGKQVSNSYEMLGVVYMTFNWEDTDEQTVFEKGKGDAIVEKVLRFINDAHNRAEGTLVHSVHGQSRSYCLLAAYLMRKYRWSLEKSLGFLSAQRPDAQPKPGLLRQLAGLEQRLQEGVARPLSKGWDAEEARTGGLARGAAAQEEVVIRNTYLNARGLTGGRPAEAPGCRPQPAPPGPRIQWSPRIEETRLFSHEMPLGRDPPSGVKAKPVLKGGAARLGPIAIDTAHGTVRCYPDEIVPRRLGLQLSHRTLLLEYVVPKRGLRAHHPIPVAFDPEGGPDDAVLAAALQRKHAHWLAQVSTEQLVQLIKRLRDGGG